MSSVNNGDDDYVITLVSTDWKLDGELVKSISQSIDDKTKKSAYEIEKIKWLSEKTACDIFFNFSYHFSKNTDASLLYNKVKNIIGKNRIDFAIQPASNRRKKLLISDMDSTIIEQECIDELAEYIGIGQKVSTITERAMSGELDFVAALEERVKLLTGLEKSSLETVYDNRIVLCKGAKTLVQTMKKNGAYTLLVSGGFTYFTNKVATELGFDANEANSLDFDSTGRLTGKLIYPILDKQAKLDSLNRHCEKLGISANDVIAVGDGANDLPMIERAGIGISFYGKDIVQNNADAAINYTDLTSLLYFQGYSESDFI